MNSWLHLTGRAGLPFLLMACGTSVSSGTDAVDGGIDSGSAVPDSGLFVEIRGSGEAPLTAGCHGKLGTSVPPHPILAGPAFETMAGELNGVDVIACRETGGASPRVILQPVNIYSIYASGTYPVGVEYDDPSGTHWGGSGTMTVILPPEPCANDGSSAPAIVRGSYKAAPIKPIVPLDAGIPDGGLPEPLPALSGTFRVLRVCLNGGA
jgi:hypothetical protein